MRRSTLVMCALLVAATYGCDRIRPQMAKVGASTAAIGTAIKVKFQELRDRLMHRKTAALPAPAPAPTPGPAPTPAPPPPPPPPAPAPVTNVSARPQRDVPYASADTGTIDPGMHERDVYSLWGPPAAVRHLGEFTWLYFRNGCEYTCGIMDVVTLQNGLVVDAILRWPGHGYSGESSSPASTLPHGPVRREAPPPMPADTTPAAAAPAAGDTVTPDTTPH
ncbi:MAG TPA: hypothetical protein VLV16_14415 [Gemmatimonadales bacterium]|nr:hypothetical protein [Gemmatimonadales bacterium]